MDRKYIVLLIALIVLVGCEGADGETLSTNPFIGGTDGLTVAFEPGSPPEETFDAGASPFDVIVKLENLGEEFVSMDHVRVKISGIHPADFSQTEADLTKNAPDDLIEAQQDATGKIIQGTQTFVEFTGLNHQERVAGASLSFPIRADACYLYKTTAASKLCVRENILNPQEGGLCEITGPKTVFNSGAPIQVANFAEQARAKDKVGFTFDITHPGIGSYYEQGSDCDQTQRRNSQRVFVRVETKVPGLTCTGLLPGGDGTVENFVQIFDDTRTISCTQQFPSLGDFELPVRIEVSYDYLQSAQTSIVVRNSGE